MKAHTFAFPLVAFMASALAQSGSPVLRGSPGHTEGRVAARASVGVPVDVRNVVWSGSELEVAPVELATPIVLRITDVRPHGDALRYDLVVYGLDPGEYDLADFVRRSDGSATLELEPVPFTVASILPPGQVEPNPLQAGEAPVVGGYTRLLWIAGGLWCLGLAAILFVGRRRRAHAAAARRPASLADRLRPLVEQALAGRLSREDRAALELTLIAAWRQRLDLGRLGTAEALAKLKRHDEAGPLLRSLEHWLHRPDGPGGPDRARAGDVDLARLLEPYRNLPAEAFRAPVPPPATHAVRTGS